MQLTKLLSDDEAVSPVIGVILMVAITVILAAVIASFVLGLGGNTQTAPTADFSFNYDSSNTVVTVTHSGGATIRSDELYIRGTDIVSPGQWSGSTSGSIEGVSAVVSGDTQDVQVNGDAYVLRVVWESVNGETSSELAVDRGPAA